VSLGWYVHHHGAGHLTRMLALRRHLDLDVIVLSSLPEPAALPPRTRWVVLPRDDDGVSPSASPTARGAFHWAPLRHSGHRTRLAALADAARDEPLDAVVVDVSVEVAVVARLLGVPTVVVSQPGDRTDAPHALAYRTAEAIIAPWPEGVLSDAALRPVRDRVLWTGGISRFEPGLPDLGESTGAAGVVVLGPQPGLDLAGLRAAAEAEGLDYREVGTDAGSWVADPASLIASAEVVVTAAGQNSVADLAALDARAVVVPQVRPFGEQEATARALDRLGLAVVASGDSGPRAWRDLLDRARGLDPSWERWQVAGASARAAERIRETTE
jgi:hypothetical protein